MQTSERQLSAAVTSDWNKKEKKGLEKKNVDMAVRNYVACSVHQRAAAVLYRLLADGEENKKWSVTHPHVTHHFLMIWEIRLFYEGKHVFAQPFLNTDQVSKLQRKTRKCLKHLFFIVKGVIIQLWKYCCLVFQLQIFNISPNLTLQTLCHTM